MRSRVFAAVVTVVAMIGAGWAGWRTAPRAVPAAVPAACALPAARYSADSFIRMLADCGISSAAFSPIHMSDILGLLPSEAYGIRTNRGTMSAAFFPAPIQGKVAVRPNGTLSWELTGLRDEPQRIGSNHPLYFIIDQNMLLMIDDQALYHTMASLLHAKE